MLKMINDQMKSESIKNAINQKANLFHSFKIEDNNNIICAIVTQGNLEIKLGVEGNLLNLTDAEIRTIKSQITA